MCYRERKRRGRLKRKRKTLKGGSGGGEESGEEGGWREKSERTYFRNDGSQVHGNFAIHYKEIKFLPQNMSF